jgi:hypothetical protein
MTTITAKEQALELGIPKDYVRRYGDLRERKTWEQALAEWGISVEKNGDSDIAVDEADGFLAQLKASAKNLKVPGDYLIIDPNRPHSGYAAAIDAWIRDCTKESPGESIEDVAKRVDFSAKALHELDKISSAATLNEQRR